MPYSIVIKKDGAEVKEIVNVRTEVLVDILLSHEGTPEIIGVQKNILIDSAKDINTRPLLENASKKVGGKQRICHNCHKPGHRADRCPKKETSIPTVSSEDEEDEIAEGALDRMQYSQVKELKQRDMNSRDVAKELDIDDNEVRIVFASATYEGYLRLR